MIAASLPDATRPLVSVVVPNYNYARFLERRLQSIFDQTFQDFELILLDDASTDDSVTILRHYATHPRVVHVEINAENTGSPFRQWMKGISLAHGTWIWMAEADDTADSSFLYKCVAALRQEPEAVGCMVGSTFIDEAERPLPAGRANYWDSIKGYAASAPRSFVGKDYAARKLYWTACIPNVSATLFRRTAALRLADSPFLNMRCSGDWLFWFQMVMQGRFVEIYDNLNGFRQHTCKVTNNAKQTGRGIDEDLSVVAAMEQALPELSVYTRRLCHGLIYQRIKHLPVGTERQQELFEKLQTMLGGTVADYRLMRRNRLLRHVMPWLTTWERQRGHVDASARQLSL